MTNQRRVSNVLQLLWSKHERARWKYGTIGRINADGTVTIVVDLRPDFVHVLMSTGTYSIARNAGHVPLRAGLPVRMRDEGGVLVIDGVDSASLENDAEAPDEYGVLPHPLSSHNDVTVTAAASGDVLAHDGTNWVDETPVVTSAGAGDAGKLLRLDAGGQVDATAINDADIDHGSLGGLADDDHAQYHNDARGDLLYAPIAKGVTNGDAHDHTGGDGGTIAYGSLSGTPSIPTQYTDENARDAIGTALVAGTNISIAVSDAGDTITINNTFSNELIQDEVGGMVGSGANVDVVYDDALNTLTISAPTEGIQDIIGAMIAGNVETGVAVTYDDTNGKLDFDAQTAGDARYAAIPVTGTWTPQLRFGGANVSMTFTSRSGTYTKIADLVFAQGDFTLSAKGSSTGNADISGLPFTVVAAFQTPGRWSAMVTAFVNMWMIPGAGTTTIVVRAITAASTSAGVTLTHADFNNTSNFTFNVIYKV